MTYLAGGRDLLRLQASAASRQDPVVVAAPDYSAEPAPSPEGRRATRSQPSADTRGLWFSPLRFAAEEGRAIAQKLPGARLLTGTAATESAIKALAGPRVLHIATHGFFLPEEPAVHAAPPGDLGAGFRAWDGLPRPRPAVENPLLRSGIALAGANRRHSEQDDGLLTALELSQVDLTGTKLVVLSACETGVGEIRSGDGVYGLRRALVMAGAETQVISLWSVDDAATRELMEAYYNKLLAGGRRGEAMRQAQIEMLRRPGRAHPYYWASFIVSGSDAPLEVASTFAKSPTGMGSGPTGNACGGGSTSAADARRVPNVSATPVIAVRMEGLLACVAERVAKLPRDHRFTVGDRLLSTRTMGMVTRRQDRNAELP